MAEPKGALKKRVTDLEERIDRVQSVVGEATFKLEIEDNLRAAIVAKLQKDAEDALVNSPLFKGSKRLLIFAIVVGLAVWISGSIYSGIAIKSIYDRSEEVQKKLEIEVGKVATAATMALSSIQNEKDSVRNAFGAFKDLKEIQRQVDELRKADGQLKIFAIRSLIRYSTLALVVINLLLIGSSFILWIKLFQKRRN